MVRRGTAPEDREEKVIAMETVIAMMRRLVILALAGALVSVAACGDDDDGSGVEVVEEVVDAHHQAWEDDDAAGVGAFFTDDGVFIDLLGVESAGRDDVVAYAEVHVPLITEVRRTGPVEVAEDGTFVVPIELVVSGQQLFGDVVVAVEDELIALYDLQHIEGYTR